MLDELSIRLTCECGCESVATFESSRIFELRIFHDQSVRVAILKKSELIQIYTERGREGGVEDGDSTNQYDFCNSVYSSGEVCAQ